MKLSEKQLAVCRSDAEMIIMDGSVRSGKTVAGLFALLTHAWQHFEGATFLVGVIGEHAWNGPIKRTLMLYEQQTGVRCDMTARHITMPSKGRYPNRFVKVVCRDVTAVSRIQGDTIAGCFGTEVVHYPIDAGVLVQVCWGEEPQTDLRLQSSR